MIIIGIIVICLIYFFPIPSLILGIIIGVCVLVYYLDKWGAFKTRPKVKFIPSLPKPELSPSLPKVKLSPSPPKVKLEYPYLIAYEFVVWFSFPFVLLYLLSYDFTSGAINIAIALLSIILSLVLTALRIISKPLIAISTGQRPRNTIVLFSLEFLFWTLTTPIVIVGFLTFFKVSSGLTLSEVWESSEHFLAQFIVGTIFIANTIGPIFASIGIITRPFLNNKIKVDNDKKEIIKMLEELTR